MKKILIIILISLSFYNCKKEFENNNNVTADAAYQAPLAYPGIILGMTKDFAINSYNEIVRGPGLTAHELGNIGTYITEPELERGGIALTSENSSITILFNHLHKNRGIAEKILENIDGLHFDDPLKKVAYKAYAKFFKAITTGYMAQYWEKVTEKNDPDNQANYIDRMTALQNSVDLLGNAIADLNNNPGAEDFINNLVSYEFSFKDVLLAFKARYEIELGNYQAAYDDANAVDLTKRSVWSYDGGAIKNPIYNIAIYSTQKRYKPIDSLGLFNTQTPELGDKRNEFYLEYITNASYPDAHYQIDDPKGFWDTDDKPIPVYLPGEMILIKAEAKARMNQLSDAVSLIDDIRTKTAAQDVFGVGAELSAWTGNATNQQDVLDEIYKNYAIELYMQGQRWPIHRRFYPNYLDNVDWNTVDVYSLERVNNFYPYPYQERASNPNTPPDPAY